MALTRFALNNILILLLCNLAFTQDTTCDTDNCEAANFASSTALLQLLGTSEYTKEIDGSIKFDSKINITETRKHCPTLEDANHLTQYELIEYLTASCRYDRLKRPEVLVNDTLSNKPVTVTVRLNIEVLQNSDSSNPQLQADGVLQLNYTDPRLRYNKLAASRNLNILGNEGLEKLIWTPRLYFTNEQRDIPLKMFEENILTAIEPNGQVRLWQRVQATLDCKLNLQMFPFDEQTCATIIESWMYNATELQIVWDASNPLQVVPKSGLMEFMLQSYLYNDTTVDSNAAEILFLNDITNEYTALKFTLYLTRQSGYYIMQYFLPSMMIVAISWVSFWLQPDQTPARTTLGTTTMLSFITLGSSQEKNLPKVNYIKLSEIWFFACNAFIFCSLVEFAFVNTIWRRKNNVTLKRINSTHILKNTLTPQNNRQLPKKLRKVQSVSSAISETERFSYAGINELDVKDLTRPDSSYSSLSVEDNPFHFKIDNIANNSTETNLNADTTPKRLPLSSMTPHEVSLWIDRKARFAFPLAFILFNAVFWTIVNIR